MSQLLPFIVLYTDDTFTVPEASIFQAEDSDHAESQFASENPQGTVAWIVQTDNVESAFNTYHDESALEPGTKLITNRLCIPN